MALFGKDKSSSTKRDATRDYLASFVESRSGVAAYFEAGTPTSPTALVLVADNGEWTRRKVPGMKDATKLARELGIEIYDVAATGYPRSMREWTIRNQKSKKRQ